MADREYRRWFLERAGYGFIRPGVAVERDMSSRIRLHVRLGQQAECPLLAQSRHP
jgi:hypothetical protein